VVDRERLGRRDPGAQDPVLPHHRRGQAVAPEAEQRVVGIRPGEKIHEEMITASDSPNTVDLGRTTPSCPAAARTASTTTARAPARSGCARASATTAAATPTSCRAAAARADRAKQVERRPAPLTSASHDGLHSLQPPAGRRGRRRRRHRGAALGLPHPGAAGAGSSRIRDPAWRGPCGGGEQCHCRPAPGLPGAGRGAGLARMDHAQQLPGLCQLRAVLRRPGRLRRHRPAHAQPERKRAGAQARAGRARGHACHRW
jgi:hypothetical protein